MFFACSFFAIPTNYVYAEDTTEVFPSSYNLRNDISIPTKNQGGFGLCWAFTSCRVVETLLLKNFNYSVDLSESWASLAYMNYVNDDDYTKSYGTSPNFDIQNYTYGNAAHYLNFQNAMNTYGFAIESEVPYSIGSAITTENYSDYFTTYQSYASKELVTNIQFKWCGHYDEDIAEPDINEEVIIPNIKNYVYNYGGVYTAINTADLRTIDGVVCVYSSSGSTPINHAVTIVGFDDNFSVTIGGVSHTGAFIVANSYGTTNEYFYVLYDDYNVIRNCYYIDSLRYNDIQMDLVEVEGYRVTVTDPTIVLNTLQAISYLGAGFVLIIVAFIVPTIVLKGKSSKLNRKLTAQKILHFRAEQERIAKEHELIRQRIENFKEEMRKREERRIKKQNNN